MSNRRSDQARFNDTSIPPSIYMTEDEGDYGNFGQYSFQEVELDRDETTAHERQYVTAAESATGSIINPELPTFPPAIPTSNTSSRQSTRTTSPSIAAAHTNLPNMTTPPQHSPRHARAQKPSSSSDEHHESTIELDAPLPVPANQDDNEAQHGVDHEAERSTGAQELSFNDRAMITRLFITNKSIMFGYPGPLVIIPDNLILTTVEVLTFFPGMMRDAGFVYRLQSNGWDIRTTSFILNMMRNWPNQGLPHFSRSVATSNIRDGMKLVTGISGWTEGKFKADDYVKLFTKQHTKEFTLKQLSAYHVPNEEKKEIRLSELLIDVKEHRPQGNDRGALTIVLDLIKEKPELDRPLSEIFTLIEENDLVDSIKDYDLQKDLAAAVKWNSDAESLPARYFDTTNGSKWRAKSHKTHHADTAPRAAQRQSTALTTDTQLNSRPSARRSGVSRAARDARAAQIAQANEVAAAARATRAARSAQTGETSQATRATRHARSSLASLPSDDE